MNYLIVYNDTQAGFNEKDLHNTIVKMNGISDWWHYLPNVYIVSTIQAKNEKSIANNILTKHPGLLFLVVQVNLTAHNGVLPKNAWEWISKKIKTVLRVKPAPSSALTDYFRGIPRKPAPSSTQSGLGSIEDMLRRFNK
ncbi:hypothetical protein KBC70_01965 [Candidatus Woesebacteria bacterium]|nr:hypothetical protein [Candidatus Woesebacteria bacterium]